MPGAGLTALRAAMTAFFALDGFLFAGWVVRIPDIKHQTHASTGALGLALPGVSAGAVLTMTLSVGRLVLPAHRPDQRGGAGRRRRRHRGVDPPGSGPVTPWHGRVVGRARR
ncbi:hypothetical protein S1361_05485 [Streptomyces cyanogenus]|uniref:Uncharacterized protein n=1 Tax=Streptomyces cyanogenus TaxID=80860 RepID=A0ABX7TME5_STRCY|nr:hypothetical protein S1361_05485 [Streptomyces cyanogenus]